MIGDANQGALQGLMGAACNANGCSPDSTQTVQFNWTQTSGGLAGYADPATATFTMSGNIDNDPAIETALLSAVSSALIASSSCQTVESRFDCHSLAAKRMVGPPIGLACSSADL
jgi:hypothetical protein